MTIYKSARVDHNKADNRNTCTRSSNYSVSTRERSFRQVSKEDREGRLVAWTRALLVPPLNTSENIHIHVDAHARESRRGEDRSAEALYTCDSRQFVVTICLECAYTDMVILIFCNL